MNLKCVVVQFYNGQLWQNL